MKPTKVVIVGIGNRGSVYSKYAINHPDKMKIVGVVDPDSIRRQKAKELFHIEEKYCFEKLEDFLSAEPFADGVINCTMDHLHVPTSIPILKKGYDLLLEKPYAISKEETVELAQIAKELNRKVMICHVLRYSPFYQEIKKRLLENEVGKIISIQTTEHVSYHHMAVSYVRGKWGNKDKCHTSMLLSKCCHDLDLIMWMNNGTQPEAVSSFGGRHFFTEDNRPANAGTRCMTDCPIEQDCQYSAKKHYIEKPTRWNQYVWTCIEHIKNPTIEDKIQSMKTDNPYGKCVWCYDNNVVDRQVVSIQFKDGSVSSHTMLGGAPRSQRYIHIIGTEGEIRGVFEDSKFTVRKIHSTEDMDYTEEVIDLEINGDMVGAYGGHGGGDLRLVEDFIHFITNQETSFARTTIEDSMNSHLAAFYADQAMEENKVIFF